MTELHVLNFTLKTVTSHLSSSGSLLMLFSILSYILLKQVYKEIQEETEKHKHYRYGMFVLVIMSQGVTKDVLLDCANQEISLQKIRDLLSAANFPAMRGKPKLMIVQADFMGKFMFISNKDLNIV